MRFWSHADIKMSHTNLCGNGNKNYNVKYRVSQSSYCLKSLKDTLYVYVCASFH